MEKTRKTFDYSSNKYLLEFWRETRFNQNSKDIITVSFEKMNGSNISVLVKRLKDRVDFGQVNFETSAVEEIVNYLTRIYTLSMPEGSTKTCLLKPCKTTHNIDLNTCMLNGKRIIQMSKTTPDGTKQTLILLSQQIPFVVEKLLQGTNNGNFTPTDNMTLTSNSLDQDDRQLQTDCRPTNFPRLKPYKPRPCIRIALKDVKGQVDQTCQPNVNATYQKIGLQGSTGNDLLGYRRHMYPQVAHFLTL